jgi:radical SAM-linked protein
MTEGAFQRGWKHVKLYFMIGLPTERDDDVEAIADLAIRTLEGGKKIRQNARVHLGISTFVPKPFTPFQWAAQLSLEETERRQGLLGRLLQGVTAIKYGRHAPQETLLEGLVSRGDRRAGDLIEAAFRKGCRFDAWTEHLRFDLWQEAIEETGFDVEDALRERAIDERLPWDHLDVLIPKSWFAWDWEQALQLKHAEDCRHKKCHKCGVIDEERELCAHMLRNQIKARESEETWTRSDPTPYVEPPPVQRLWIRISRTGQARFLSHLESHSAWVRALRRAGAPLAYSQGFHPQPKIAFSTANPCGEETVGDYLDVTLVKKVEVDAFLAHLRTKLPEDFGAHSIHETPLKSASLMSLAQGGAYTIVLPHLEANEVKAKVGEIQQAESLWLDRKGKTRTKRRGRRRERVIRKIDIRPMIRGLTVRAGEGAPAVDVEMVAVEGKPGKARELLSLFTDDPAAARVIKRETLIDHEGEWVRLDHDWRQEG